MPEFKKILKNVNLQNVIAVFVFSGSRCKNAFKMRADLCPCFHRSPTKLCPDLVSFVCWIATEFWSFTSKSVPDLVIRTLNCARLCVVCALNCARIFVIRALDCAQMLLHPALFLTQLEHCHRYCINVVLHIIQLTVIADTTRLCVCLIT